MRRLSLILIGAATTIALAACGGGSTPSPSAPASVPVSAPAASSAPASAAAGSAAAGSAAAGSAAAGACAVAPASATATVNATIKDFKFSPDPIQAKVGDVISWTNNDTVGHTVTLDDNSCSTDTIAVSSSGLLTFTAPGTYTYHCKIHPTQMNGYKITVQ